jgi:hypothetical protein
VTARCQPREIVLAFPVVILVLEESRKLLRRFTVAGPAR